jgi:hypothetical protein
LLLEQSAGQPDVIQEVGSPASSRHGFIGSAASEETLDFFSINEKAPADTTRDKVALSDPVSGGGGVDPNAAGKDFDRDLVVNHLDEPSRRCFVRVRHVRSGTSR